MGPGKDLMVPHGETNRPGGGREDADQGQGGTFKARAPQKRLNTGDWLGKEPKIATSANEVGRHAGMRGLRLGYILQTIINTERSAESVSRPVKLDQEVSSRARG